MQEIFLTKNQSDYNVIKDVKLIFRLKRENETIKGRITRDIKTFLH